MHLDVVTKLLLLQAEPMNQGYTIVLWSDVGVTGRGMGEEAGELSPWGSVRVSLDI